MATKSTKAAKPQAFVGPVAPQAPALPLTLATALLSMVNAPATASDAPPVTANTVMYVITAKAKVIAPHLTLQRGCTIPVGANWRANGHKATNTRALVMECLHGLGGAFTHDQALAALKPLKDAAMLGSGTPASYLRAFVKSGYLAEAVN